MEVKSENAAMLGNYEVMSLLRDLQKRQNKPNKMQSNLATISYEITQYLENTACFKQSPEIITGFMKGLEPFKLTKAEKLQMLNLRPRTAVEIQLIVEESEERLTEDQIYQLLKVVSEHLPGGEEEVVEEEQPEMDETEPS